MPSCCFSSKWKVEVQESVREQDGATLTFITNSTPSVMISIYESYDLEIITPHFRPPPPDTVALGVKFLAFELGELRQFLIRKPGSLISEKLPTEILVFD